MSNENTRCTGNWLGVSGEFGRTLNPVCLGCQRRNGQASECQEWMTVAVIPVDKCIYKIEARCKWPSCQTPEFQDALASEVASELIGDVPCNPHPDAPHGFNRNASHAAGRAVCDCEGWTPD